MDEALKKEIYYFLNKTLANRNTEVQKAMVHIALSKGHLWRPLLIIKIARGFGVSTKKSMPYATAAELVHCATLVLDDLPSMDDADMRRGKESCHIKFGVDIAELCSLGFVAESILLMSQGEFTDEQKIKAIREIATAAKAMIRGQEKDLHETKSMSLDEIINFYKLKSGSLYAASAVIGGILGNASEKELRILRKFGMDLGVAYQLGDDIYDRIAKKEDLGKPVQKDTRKKTPIDIIGIKKTISLKEEYRKKAKQHAEKINKDIGDLIDNIIGIMNYGELTAKAVSN